LVRKIAEIGFGDEWEGQNLRMTPVQCRMARAALKWGVLDLASRADVTKNTIVRFEAGKPSYESTASRLERALLAEGVTFFEDLGVRAPSGS
jgi:transcriptional regulator with XRE-family HTH domain